MAWRPWVAETARDAGFLAAVFFNWLLLCVVVDAVAPNDVSTRRGASTYIAVFSTILNAVSFGRSVSFLGSPNAPPESVFGLFAEIVNLTQVWGTLYAAGRYWSLPDDHAFMGHPLLHTTATSIFEMSLVQAGVGWASEAPTNAIERFVAWCAAYLGGVLATNMFFMSIIMARRGYWERPVAQGGYAPVAAAAGHWTLNLKA